MKKIIYCLIVIFCISFGHVYQKVKIITLAYQIHDKKVCLDRSLEQNANLFHSFHQQINLATINTKLNENGLQLRHSAKYVKISPVDQENRRMNASRNLLAKILGIGAEVEAQP